MTARASNITTRPGNSTASPGILQSAVAKMTARPDNISARAGNTTARPAYMNDRPPW